MTTDAFFENGTPVHVYQPDQPRLDLFVDAVGADEAVEAAVVMLGNYHPALPLPDAEIEYINGSVEVTFL